MVDQIIYKFRELLIKSWPIITQLQQDDKLGVISQNWLEANWEIILEGMLNQGGEIIYLGEYGEGAEDMLYGFGEDLNNKSYSNRIIFPNQSPTHLIHCINSEPGDIYCQFSGKKIAFPKDGLKFEQFVTMKNDRATMDLPFDCALLEANPFPVVAKLKSITFTLVQSI